MIWFQAVMVSGQLESKLGIEANNFHHACIQAEKKSEEISKTLQQDVRITSIKEMRLNVKPRVSTYKGFKIHETTDRVKPEQAAFIVYTTEEWLHGKGLRYPEWEAGTMQEAKDFIDSY